MGALPSVGLFANTIPVGPKATLVAPTGTVTCVTIFMRALSALLSSTSPLVVLLTSQVTAPTGKVNSTIRLRITASAFARCNPVCIDSAAAWIWELSSHILKFGAATAIRIPMMATATMISINVKPRLPICRFDLNTFALSSISSKWHQLRPMQ